jgi:hypothetical protein
LAQARVHLAQLVDVEAAAGAILQQMQLLLQREMLLT